MTGLARLLADWLTTLLADWLAAAVVKGSRSDWLMCFAPAGPPATKNSQIMQVIVRNFACI